MKISSPLLTFSIFILSVSWAVSGTSDVETFLKCLTNKSESSNPISSVIYTPNNASFSSIFLSRTHNLRFTTPTTLKPLAIIAASDVSHIQATIFCAKSNEIQVRIRSGGHDLEGISYVSDVPFVILDMFKFNSIELDMENETAWVESGATLGELYYKIAEKSKTHAFPAGVCPSVGAGGHFSGGGYGNMMRKFGLSVDNIIDAKLVNVNGRILDRKSMGEGLFWAIRGGGGASFGVILSWKLKLVRVPSTVTVFDVRKTVEQGATDVVYKWQYVAPKLPEDLFIRLMPQVVNTSNGEKTVEVAFIGQFLGQADRLLSILNQSFPEMGLKKSDCFEVSWAESAVFWYYGMVGSLDLLLEKPTGPTAYYKRKSDYVKKPIPKEGLEYIWSLMINEGRMWMQWNPYGGKMAEIGEGATPFPHRAGVLFLLHYSVDWTEEEGDGLTDHFLNSSRRVYEVMTPYVSKSPRLVFLNYRDLDVGANRPSNETDFRTATIYGSKYFKSNFHRLVRVKSGVDPENFFKFEQSIPPQPIHT